MQKIILDTNFLLIPAQFKVDIFTEIERIMDSEYTLFILSKSLDELKNIVKEKKGRLAQEVKLTLAIIKKNVDEGKVTIIPTDDERHVDHIIVDMDGYMVATQDIILQKRLKAKNRRLIAMRQKSFLEFK